MRASASPLASDICFIVPLDGSSSADAALTPATALGDAFSADYVLFRSGTAEKLRAAGYEVTVVVNEEEDSARAVLRLAARTPGSASR